MGKRKLLPLNDVEKGSRFSKGDYMGSFRQGPDEVAQYAPFDCEVVKVHHGDIYYSSEVVIESVE